MASLSCCRWSSVIIDGGGAWMGEEGEEAGALEEELEGERMA